MADTDILLTVDLDVKDAERTAEQLQKEIDNIFKSRNGQQSAALTSIQIQMKKVIQQSNEVRNAMQDMLDVQDDYDALIQDFYDLNTKASELKGKLDALKDDKGRIIGDPEEAAKLQEELQKVLGQISTIHASMEELEQQQVPTEEFAKLEEELANLQKRMESKDLLPNTEEFKQVNTRIQEIRQEMDSLRLSGKSTINQEDTSQYQQYQQELDTSNDKLKQLIIRHRELETTGKTAFSKVAVAAQGLKAAFIKVLGGIKKFVASLKNLRKSSGGINTSMKSMLRNILRFGLGIGSVYMLINKLRSAVKEGFTNLYKDNKKFKDSVDSLKGSLTTLKNAFASAFQPIVSMAIPYIQRLVDWMTQLMDQIARFTAAALGQKTYMKAIKQTGQAADKASKQLSKLDNLNVLSSDSGAGGGKMFEEVPIDEEKIDLLQKLKDIVAQMESVGAKVGTAIRDALNSIDWDNIRQYTNLIAEGIGNFINGLVRVEGLGEAIGRTFGELLNTIMQFKQTLLDTIDFEDVGKFLGNIAQSFVDTFDWKGQGHLIATELNSIAETVKGFTEEFQGLTLGTSLGDMINQFMYDIDWNTINEAVAGLAEDLIGIINGLLTQTDWSKAGETVSQGISQLLDFAINSINNFDAEALGQAIIDFISHIDWLRLAGELALLLLSLLEKAVELLWGLASGLLNNIADLFDYLGMEGVAGFFRGMAENLKTSIQWLKDIFNKYVVIPIKNFFGIHSPSTLFADFGKMLIQGLFNGITEKLQLIGEVMNLLKTKLFEKFDQIKTGIVNIVENLWEAVKSPINSIIGGFEFLVNCVIKAINKMIDAMNGLSFDVPDWVPEIGGKSFGFSIPNLSEVSIPRLAQGAVIPPNKQFMAMLGDQKSGTNIEAPLDTIKQALTEVLADRSTNGGTQEIVLNLDGREILKAIVKQNGEYKKQHNGMSALA